MAVSLQQACSEEKHDQCFKHPVDFNALPDHARQQLSLRRGTAKCNIQAYNGIVSFYCVARARYGQNMPEFHPGKLRSL